MTRSNDAVLVLQYEGGTDERTRGKVEGCAKGEANFDMLWDHLPRVFLSSAPPQHAPCAVFLPWCPC